MSVSIYQGKVARLTKQIADIEAKQANERKIAAEERQEAIRIAGEDRSYVEMVARGREMLAYQFSSTSPSR